MDRLPCVPGWVFFFFFSFLGCCDWCLKELGMAFCYWFDLILGWIFFFCGFMVVELGVAVVWFDFDFDFMGCCGCRSLWLGFQAIVWVCSSNRWL